MTVFKKIGSDFPKLVYEKTKNGHIASDSASLNKYLSYIRTHTQGGNPKTVAVSFLYFKERFGLFVWITGTKLRNFLNSYFTFFKVRKNLKLKSTKPLVVADMVPMLVIPSFTP